MSESGPDDLTMIMDSRVVLHKYNVYNSESIKWYCNQLADDFRFLRVFDKSNNSKMLIKYDQSEIKFS